jgi:NDP-sugar pyrophosphorylase family protein
MLRRGAALRASPRRAFWRDIGTPAAYLRANLDLLDLLVHRSDLQRRLRVSRHSEGTLVSSEEWPRMDASAFWWGPILVGRGAVIESRADVGPGVVLGAGSIVKAGVSIRQCVVWPGAVVERDAENAIVTRECGVVPAGP